MRGMGNMNNLIKQAQKMQKKMAAAQEELLEQTVEGSAGGGMVLVEVNGSKQVTNIVIKPEVVDPDDIEMLQDLVLAATNDALKKMSEIEQKTMGQFTQGMNMPGLF